MTQDLAASRQQQFRGWQPMRFLQVHLGIGRNEVPESSVGPEREWNNVVDVKQQNVKGPTAPSTPIHASLPKDRWSPMAGDRPVVSKSPAGMPGAGVGCAYPTHAGWVSRRRIDSLQASALYTSVCRCDTVLCMVEKTRSPLKDKPLRLPGQSIQEEREDIIEDAVGQPLMLALFFVLIAGLEWWRVYSGMKPNPIVFTGVAVLLVLYAAFRISRAIPKLRNLNQALDGERAVGQFLERLRERGFQVFHDVVGGGFNVDHILIGPAGVFTIETKTWSKPRFGPPEIVFDGETLRAGGYEPDRNPVVQAKAQAGWLRSLLQESTGKDFVVRPAVVFPGWYIKNSPGSFRDVWVLEPKALPGFLDNEPERLSREDIKMASFHLGRFIRVEQARRSKSPAHSRGPSRR
jgi:hypothetical protein